MTEQSPKRGVFNYLGDRALYSYARTAGSFTKMAAILMAAGGLGGLGLASNLQDSQEIYEQSDRIADQEYSQQILEDYRDLVGLEQEYTRQGEAYAVAEFREADNLEELKSQRDYAELQFEDAVNDFLVDAYTNPKMTENSLRKIAEHFREAGWDDIGVGLSSNVDVNGLEECRLKATTKESLEARADQVEFCMTKSSDAYQRNEKFETMMIGGTAGLFMGAAWLFLYAAFFDFGVIPMREKWGEKKPKLKDYRKRSTLGQN